MQTLKKIFMNPVAVAVVTAHWLVFIFAMFYERNLIFTEAITMHGPEPVFFNFMLYLNTPSALLMQSVIYPVLSLFGKNFITISFDVLMFLIFSSLQWFGLTHLMIAVVEIYKPKEVKLSLK
jgi:hypothetical protein